MSSSEKTVREALESTREILNSDPIWSFERKAFTHKDYVHRFQTETQAWLDIGRENICGIFIYILAVSRVSESFYIEMECTN